MDANNRISNVFKTISFTKKVTKGESKRLRYKTSGQKRPAQRETREGIRNQY